MEGLILVSRGTEKLARHSKHVESRGLSGGGSIHKEFPGSKDQVLPTDMEPTRTLIILVPAKDACFRYDVLHVRKRKPSVSASFIPIPLGDTRDPNNRSSWVLRGLARVVMGGRSPGQVHFATHKAFLNRVREIVMLIWAKCGCEGDADRFARLYVLPLQSSE